MYHLLQYKLGVFASTCLWCGRFWLSAMWRSDDASRPQVGESWSVAKDRTAVSVLPPLAMTLLDAMNWRGPPMWVGLTDA